MIIYESNVADIRIQHNVYNSKIHAPSALRLYSEFLGMWVLT